MKCGREPNGERAKELGICPASICAASSGANGGVNGGRMCWAIVGTYSFGEVRGLFSKKIVCYDCEFHRKVLSEEGFIKDKQVKQNKA
jgi:hypothetical protein